MPDQVVPLISADIAHVGHYLEFVVTPGYIAIRKLPLYWVCLLIFTYLVIGITMVLIHLNRCIVAQSCFAANGSLVFIIAIAFCGLNQDCDLFVLGTVCTLETPFTKDLTAQEMFLFLQKMLMKTKSGGWNTMETCQKGWSMPRGTWSIGTDSCWKFNSVDAYFLPVTSLLSSE